MFKLQYIVNLYVPVRKKQEEGYGTLLMAPAFSKEGILN
jgi:hypothetical protein